MRETRGNDLDELDARLLRAPARRTTAQIFREMADHHHTKASPGTRRGQVSTKITPTMEAAAAFAAAPPSEILILLQQPTAPSG